MTYMLLTDFDRDQSCQLLRERVSAETSDWLEEAVRQEAAARGIWAGTPRGADHELAARVIEQELAWRGEHWRYQRAQNRIATARGAELTFDEIAAAAPPRQLAAV
jgi:hypothetical protein